MGEVFFEDVRVGEAAAKLGFDAREDDSAELHPAEGVLLVEGVVNGGGIGAGVDQLFGDAVGAGGGGSEAEPTGVGGDGGEEGRGHFARELAAPGVAGFEPAP